MLSNSTNVSSSMCFYPSQSKQLNATAQSSLCTSHWDDRECRKKKETKTKLFSFQRWVDLRASLTDKRYCSKPLALQEYSFLSSECAVNKLHLECYSVVEYANSDYDGYIRLLVLKRCLFLLISYKLPFDLYSIIV